MLKNLCQGLGPFFQRLQLAPRKFESEIFCSKVGKVQKRPAVKKGKGEQLWLDCVITKGETDYQAHVKHLHIFQTLLCKSFCKKKIFFFHS